MASVFFLQLQCILDYATQDGCAWQVSISPFGSCSKLDEAGESEDTLVYRYKVPNLGEDIIKVSLLYPAALVRL